MVSWASDGLVAGYDPITLRLKAGLYHFASSGSVDLQGITRINNAMGAGLSAATYPNSLQVTAPFTITSGDVAANPGKSLSAALYLAEASNFAAGHIPTPSEILALGDSKVRVYRATVAVNTPQTITFSMPGWSSGLLWNTKYWILLLPTALADVNSPWSVSNDQPLAGITVDTFGRALSIYANRTPAAPTITAPEDGAIAFAGSLFNLTIDPNDPDAVIPSDTHRYNDDVIGVQFQYAPISTVDDPAPAWRDLPLDAAIPGVGNLRLAAWHIKGSRYWNGLSGLPEMNAMIDNLGLSVVAGAGDTQADYQPGRGALPTGEWQLRARTFDFGHPYPNDGTSSTAPGPLGINPATTQLAEPAKDSYPATNTSPWSASVRVTIPAQVPPPFPLSPIDELAVIENETVRLTWQYRNTHQPPFDQASRSVQIRKVGDAEWSTIFDGATSLSYVDLPPTLVQVDPLLDDFSMTATNQYEWRVATTDTDAVSGNYSLPARFWMVPAVGSGEVRPDPSGTIDGAVLGCGTHRVFVYRRGGLIRVGEIRNLSYVDWGRVRDDISTSQIKVSGWDIDCGNLLAKLQPWAYELVIFRDNGFSVDRVWEGPITLLTYETDKVTIDAKDVLGYAYRRIIKQKMTDSGTGHGTTVVDRARRVIQNAFAPDDPNVLAYLRVLARDDDAMQYRSTPAYSRTAFEEVDDMAANAGLDYTCVGRSIMLWGTKHRIGTLPEFGDDDLGASPIVSVYGMSMANRYVVSDGNGVWGEATRLVDGVDETYGLVEMLSSTWASDSPNESGTYTQAGLRTVVQSFEDFAERSIASRYPPPVVVRVPDNTALNPDAVISIQYLVPGVVIPLRSTGTLRSVVASQKLDSVKVVEEAGKETVSITLSPFSRDDANAVAEGE